MKVKFCRSFAQSLVYSLLAIATLGGCTQKSSLLGQLGSGSNGAASTATAASCSFNGQTMTSGGPSLPGYPSPTVPFGQTCQSQPVTCSNGQLSPNNLFGFCTPLTSVNPSPTPTPTPTANLTSISVSPANLSVATNGTQQFSATAIDQFGNPLSVQPTFSWSVSGGGSISSSGLFTASNSAGGPFTITALSASVKGTATVTISQPAAGCSSSAGVNTWQNITPPSLAGATTYNGATFAFAIDPNNSGTVYLGTMQHGIFKTTDCGATWTGPINTGPGNPNNPGTPIPGSALNGTNGSGMIWAMTIDPTNSALYTTVGYAAGGVNLSTDGGVNWNQLLPASIVSITGNGFVNHISIDPTNHLHLVADFHVDQCTGTAPPGAAIVENNNYQNPVIVSYTQSTVTGGSLYTGWACLAETQNGGVTWTLTAAPAPWGGADGPGITVVNDKTWFFGQQGGKLWRTTTGGVAQNNQPAWTQVNLCTASGCTTPMTGSTGFVYIAQDGSFYSGGNYAVVRSTDGVNWIQISNEFGPQIYDFNGLPGIVDTGTTLYTTNNANNQYFSASISAIQNYTGTAPTSLMTQMPINSAMNGAVSQLGYDKVNHFIYTSNGVGGFWKLKTQ